MELNSTSKKAERNEIDNLKKIKIKVINEIRKSDMV